MHPTIGVLLVAGLAGSAKAGPAKSTQPVRVDFGRTPDRMASDRSAPLELRFHLANGFKINPEAPFSVKLEGNGLAFDASELTHRDLESGPRRPALRTRMRAREAGNRTVIARMAFTVCDDTVCVRVDEQIRHEVRVR